MSTDVHNRSGKLNCSQSIVDILNESNPTVYAETEESNSAQRYKNNMLAQNTAAKEKDKWTLDGLRANIVKHYDNLRPEGAFTAKQCYQWIPGESTVIVKKGRRLKFQCAFIDNPPNKFIFTLLYFSGYPKNP